MGHVNELVIHFDPTAYRCQLCRERIMERLCPPAKGRRKVTPLCGACHKGIVIPGADRIRRLLKASMRVGRPVSPYIFRRLYQHCFGHAAVQCHCGCGRYTRTDANYLPGHEPGATRFDEAHRLLIAEPQRFQDNLIAKANALYDQGLSTQGVARELGVSQAWVHKVTNTLSPEDARRLSVKRLRGGGSRRKHLPVAQIVADYNGGEGMEPRALAKKYGVSHGTIRNRLREVGVYKLLWSR